MTNQPTNIAEWEKVFFDKYRQSLYEAYPDHKESHEILLQSIKQDISTLALAVIEEVINNTDQDGRSDVKELKSYFEKV